MKIALVGIGKITIDQHVPAIAASKDWELAATVSRSGKVEGIESHTDFAAFLKARPDVPVVSLCMPPVPRFAYAEAALLAGRHVMLEKPPGATLAEVQALAQTLQRDTSGLGCEAAHLRGSLEDTTTVANHQTETLASLVAKLQDIVRSQDQIHAETVGGLSSMQHARESVAHVGREVSGVVETLHQVSDAAQQITQVALQTRLVAFNASVEAKRAGEAGAGFSVVADAVKDLSTQVESISKAIMSTIGQLDQRIQSLASDLTDQAEGGSRDRKSVV